MECMCSECDTDRNIERIADAVEAIALIGALFLIRKALDWLSDE